MAWIENVLPCVDKTRSGKMVRVACVKMMMKSKLMMGNVLNVRRILALMLEGTHANVLMGLALIIVDNVVLLPTVSLFLC